MTSRPWYADRAIGRSISRPYMKMSTRSTTYGPTNSAAITTLRLCGGKLLVAPRGHSRATLRSEPTTRQRRRRPNKGLWHIYLFISVNLNNPNLIDVVLLSKMLIYRVSKKTAHQTYGHDFVKSCSKVANKDPTTAPLHVFPHYLVKYFIPLIAVLKKWVGLKRTGMQDSNCHRPYKIQPFKIVVEKILTWRCLHYLIHWRLLGPYYIITNRMMDHLPSKNVKAIALDQRSPVAVGPVSM